MLFRSDVYDALISKRCYKAAMPHADACDLIVAERGRKFDPLIVDVFQRKAARFAAIADHYADEAALPAEDPAGHPP